MNKLCRKCGLSKPFNGFHRSTDSTDGVKNTCKSCISEYGKKNRDKQANRSLKYYYKNKDKAQYASNQWKRNNKEKTASYMVAYREVNSSILRKQRLAYWHNRRQVDPIFKLSTDLRRLILISLKRQGYTKKSRTYQLLGADFAHVHAHLVQTALRNYGEYKPKVPYHIDHIIPCASAQTEEDLIKLQHYTNLQYLTPKDNLRKSDSVNFEVIPYVNNEK